MALQTPRIEMLYWSREQEVDADGKLRSASVPYLVFGYSDESDVLRYAYAQIPKTMTVDNKTIDLDTVSVSERLADSIFKVTANYPYEEENDVSEETEVPEFGFEISGGTKHITHSLQTMGSYAPAGKTAPDYHGAINVNEENGVDGVDIVNSQFSFTEKHILSNGSVTNSYKRSLAELVGKVNSGTFKQWEAGELIFMGASGSRRGKTSKDKWEITYRFNVSMNRTNVTIGDITIPAIAGWDYLWVKYEKAVDQNLLVQKPCAAYVERVYNFVSFNFLK